jgi:hypothetical protein
MELKIGDRVQLRKAHPCSSYEWTIYRVGADIGLRCAGCGRRVMLTRREFNKRLKQLLPQQQETKEPEN